MSVRPYEVEIRSCFGRVMRASIEWANTVIGIDEDEKAERHYRKRCAEWRGMKDAVRGIPERYSDDLEMQEIYQRGFDRGRKLLEMNG